MRRFVVLSGVVLLGCVTLGSSAPLGRRIPPSKQSIEPYSGRTFGATFKAGERACVIVKGTRRTFLGLYVYDEPGNCVAWDDLGTGSVKDGLAVEWYPPRTGAYTIEVRNFGPLGNAFELAIR